MLHELAVAIAATGRRVEVRGQFNLAELQAMSAAAGAAPDWPQQPFRPGQGDVVLMPEGFDHPLIFGSVALSAARRILLVLAPSGLFGWPFVDGWSRPFPDKVDLEQLARPEHFRAMAGMGFELWTNMPALVERIEASGVRGTDIGNGRPFPFPEPLPKRYDVVTLAHNRWAELALDVVSRLDASVIHHEIPAGANDDVLRELGQARVLIHPLRIEGSSRIGLEARAMGAVPVILNSNPFRVGMDEDGGVVTVTDLEEIPRAVMGLLSNPQRLEELRQRGMRSARDQVDWDRYVRRLDEVLSRPVAEDPASQAREIIGNAIIERAEALRAELAIARTDLERERDHAREAWEKVRAMQRTRAWRLARAFWRARDALKERARTASAIVRPWDDGPDGP
jgi:hypothetical protein